MTRLNDSGQKLAIVYRLLTQLRTNPRNARTHPKAQIKKLTRIIAEVVLRALS